MHVVCTHWSSINYACTPLLCYAMRLVLAWGYPSMVFSFHPTLSLTDGHHKLVRWRMVTHAGIDGYSRLIVYLRCSTNNQARTVYELFLEAVHQYHLPSRVRSDQGGENILVAQHMIQHRGAAGRSIITGSLVHNQQIERLWRDLHHGVTLLYYRLFYYLEQHDLLDPIDEQHLYALHYIFVPRINRALNLFKNAWNHIGLAF